MPDDLDGRGRRTALQVGDALLELSNAVLVVLLDLGVLRELLALPLEVLALPLEFFSLPLEVLPLLLEVLPLLLQLLCEFFVFLLQRLRLVFECLYALLQVGNFLVMAVLNFFLIGDLLIRGVVAPVVLLQFFLCVPRFFLRSVNSRGAVPLVLCFLRGGCTRERQV